MSETTETSKYRHLVLQYCVGNGIDIGAGAESVTPSAIAIDLPDDEYAKYHSGLEPNRPVAFKGDARDLPFKDKTLDYVYSSHLLEDFFEWEPVLAEWARVLKPGGYLIILVPDKDLWAAAIALGQPPNCQHTHESHVGELTEYIGRLGGFTVLTDSLTACDEHDYSILFVARKN